MRIGIDLDDVLVPFLQTFIKYYNLTYDTSYKMDDFFSYHYWEITGETRDESIQKVYDFHQTPYFKNMKPIAGAQEAVNQLRLNHDLFVITSRQDYIAEVTKLWVNQYFPHAFSDIVLTNNFAKGSNSRTKRQYCDLLGIEVLIDDSPEYAVECLAPGRKILLPDRPWNQGLGLTPGINRVYSWQEIIKNI
jgi:5'(3')-deoxyribonucleotidase